MRHGILLCVCLLALYRIGHAQDHTWWANTVQWDGVSHWKTYLISSPGFLGPNALPVPALPNGKTPDKHALEVEIQGHYRTGDQTANPVLKAAYAVTPGKIALQLEFTPVEYFSVSHDLKTERHVFHREYDAKTATGDVYLHTYLQLLQQPKHSLDAMLRIGYRFPTSNGVGAARFTDTPGYYFDVSGGRALSTRWRIFGMLGFFVWQTNQSSHAQNDAFLCGAGASWSAGSWHLDGGVRAYFGYQENKDDPIVARLQLNREFGKMAWHIGLQQGLQDYLYTSLFTGWQWHFK